MSIPEAYKQRGYWLVVAATAFLVLLSLCAASPEYPIWVWLLLPLWLLLAAILCVVALAVSALFGFGAVLVWFRFRHFFIPRNPDRRFS
ncbi:MAG TPA: hypothetical protein VFL54_09140 [Gammaproteobacteria bacterium]|nr:hypothetical protein [Gammaproteobacteria bacterium]